MTTKATAKFKTPTMSGSISGNIAGVAQELFQMIDNDTVRATVLKSMEEFHRKVLQRKTDAGIPVPAEL